MADDPWGEFKMDDVAPAPTAPPPAAPDAGSVVLEGAMGATGPGASTEADSAASAIEGAESEHDAPVPLAFTDAEIAATRGQTP